jgi:hypothetical protein
LRLSSEFFDAATGFIDSSVRSPPGGEYEFAFLGLNADRRRAVRWVFRVRWSSGLVYSSPISRARWRWLPLIQTGRLHECVRAGKLPESRRVG